MSLTLGEKLREARETRGISISEVAEQTRISALYLESIENNDYKNLPGGIFNKGFVKSYAKYVGVGEQEALQDYSRLLAEQGGDANDEPKTYHPQVLTDDNSRSSLLPTLIFSVIILGLIVWGALAFIKNYNSGQTAVDSNANKTENSPANSNTNAANTNLTPPVSANEIKAEFKAVNAPISVSYTVDGKTATKTVTPNAPLELTAQQNLRIVYYKSFTPDKVQLTVNGKQIQTPATPAKGNLIEIFITKENIGQILQSGTITETAPPNANAANRASRP